MSHSKRLTYLLILAGVVGLHQPAVAQEAQERLLGRSWTCDASIFLINTTQQFTPPTWKMETSHPDTVWGDREKSCRKYVENRILTGSIWNHFNLSPAEQDRVCKGGGSFRVEYGFDKRPKSWTFTKSVPPPPCSCQDRCPTGYDLDTTSSPGHPRCVRLLCGGAAAGIPNDRFGPHENGIGIWEGNIYHHQPVQLGPCKFK